MDCGLHDGTRMNNAAPRTLRTFLQRVLLASALAVGTALTWGSVWVGVTRATGPACRRPKISTARLG